MPVISGWRLKLFVLLMYFTTSLVLSGCSLNNDKLNLVNTEIKHYSVKDKLNADIEYSIEYNNGNINTIRLNNENHKAYVEHQKKLMSIVESTYDTQQWMTIVILVIVTILVFGGLYMSYLQFKADINNKPLPENGNSKTQIKMGKEGFEISSSIIGILILFMSFMFFYLYVKDVYTIKSIASIEIAEKAVSK